MSSEPERAEPEGDGGRLRGPWWFRRRRELTDEQRHSLLAQLYFEGAERAPFLARFAILLSLSLLIATFGLAEDSGPVVIGAMLISPLTTPLLGLSASLVMGWPRRQLESVAILLVASLAGVALAYLVMAALPEPQSLTLQSRELLARTEPQLLDLAIAIVAGAAGAYVLVRREAIGALPGVAIAVALVPPLATVGMMLELGETGLAGEALLLYVTNVAGIVLAASLVLVASGVQPHRVKGRLPRQTRFGIVGALVVSLALIIPLQQSTRNTVTEAVDRDDAASAAESWAAGSDLEIADVRVRDDAVDVDVRGPRRPPAVEQLATELSRRLEREVEVTVGWTKQRVTRARASP